jgi:hypothetical protein
MGTCKGAFPLHILQKQCHPLALQTMNCTPADYRLQKSVGQTTNRNRARLPSLFGMKFTQVPSQYSKGIGEVKATIEVWVRAKADNFRTNTRYGRYSAAYNMVGLRCFNEKLSLLPKNPTEAKLQATSTRGESTEPT